eukprot:9005947-Karenia_brevis.AAC.1
MDAHCLRCALSVVFVRRPFFEDRVALPKGSLQRACIVSPPTRRAAALDGASFRTVSGPVKKFIKASVTFSTAVLSCPTGAYDG